MSNTQSSHPDTPDLDIEPFDVWAPVPPREKQLQSERPAQILMLMMQAAERELGVGGAWDAWEEAAELSLFSYGRKFRDAWCDARGPFGNHPPNAMEERRLPDPPPRSSPPSAPRRPLFRPARKTPDIPPPSERVWELPESQVLLLMMKAVAAVASERDAGSVWNVAAEIGLYDQPKFVRRSWCRARSPFVNHAPNALRWVPS